LLSLELARDGIQISSCKSNCPYNYKQQAMITIPVLHYSLRLRMFCLSAAICLWLQVQEVDDLAGLEIGDLVALRTETLQDAPWIGRVTGMEGDKISLVWMEGDYNKQWKVTKHRFKGKLQEWTDCVDKCSIILYGFELTKADRLRKPTVDALMALYNEFCG